MEGRRKASEFFGADVITTKNEEDGQQSDGRRNGEKRRATQERYPNFTRSYSS